MKALNSGHNITKNVKLVWPSQPFMEQKIILDGNNRYLTNNSYTKWDQVYEFLSQEKDEAIFDVCF